ncbi:BACON domain-containing protein [uncultured Bacteroides sp.]|uniref:BACON domain-containing protein n=1 Tax=uncultured Bacteroides sp. TaxID=162156 RepID=UPI000340A42C|nr:BACON domain-containing carbohydrate-binding protein [uncultured Bacteroides sp.]CDA82863.1 putative uncharacterized protein [Bacteroides sp. CAG:754]
MRYFLFILLAGLFSACSADDDSNAAATAAKLEVSKNEVKLSNVNGSFTINITATSEWTAEVTSTGGWLSISKNSGEGNGDLRLFFTENTDGPKRTGTVKVSMTGAGSTLEQEISVEQLGADPDILFDCSSDPLPFREGTFVCKVVANVEWDVDIAEEYNWIKLKETTPRTRSFATDEVTFTVDANANQEDRTAILAFNSVGDYTLQRILKVTQDGVSGKVTIEQDEYILPYKFRTLVISAPQGENPVDYDASISETWITQDKRNSTTDEVVLNIEDNSNSPLPRTATVKILDKTLTIFQYGRPDTSIGDDTSTSILAFPGAEGGGRFTTGGRGGEIYHVTTLADYNQNETPVEGSLRYGVEKSNQPRTIVFDVSGVIELKRGLYLNEFPNLSIIGQTAPGDGITLKNYNFTFNLAKDPAKGAGSSLNAIVRFLRCRPGDQHADYGEDAIGGRYFKDAIIDHVTASWSVDETLTFYGVQNFTAQWCIASESLNLSNHAKGAHGYGAMFSGDNASFHHILLAHHGSRCPRISDLSAPGTQESFDFTGYFDVRNNVYYNWSGRGQGSYGGKYATFNLTNCYYKPGPATGTNNRSYRVLSSDPTARAYINGNYVAGSSDVTADNWTRGIWEQFDSSLGTVPEAEKQAMKMADYQPYSKVTNHTAIQAYDKVLEYAGASLRRDVIDQRVIREVKEGTYTYIGSKPEEDGKDKQLGLIDTVADTEGYVPVKSLTLWPDTDGDGIPDIWEEAYGLNPNDPSDAWQINSSVDPNGRYPNIEVYFHNLVQHIIYYQNQGGVVMEKK